MGKEGNAAVSWADCFPCSCDWRGSAAQVLGPKGGEGSQALRSTTPSAQDRGGDGESASVTKSLLPESGLLFSLWPFKFPRSGTRQALDS